LATTLRRHSRSPPASGGEDLAALRAEALRNLASQEAAVESIDVDGSPM
jgi:hypothetical protein